MENSKPLISVIIPVYNVDQYLEQCINSVLKQTYPNIEIIFIDDGSTDLSGVICDKFEKEYDNIIVIHQSNQGLAGARNKGIDVSNGKYIGFLDSDDWIEPDMYDTLYNLIEKYDADISSCLSNDIVSYKKRELKKINNKISIYKSFDIIKALYTQSEIRFEVWNKLWKREFIGDNRFMIGQVCEDVRFDRLLFMKANMIVHINAVCHNYRVNRPGNTLSSFKIAKLCIFKELKKWIDDIVFMDESQEAVLILKTIYLRFSYCFYMEAVDKKQEKNIMAFLTKTFSDYYYDVIDGGKITKMDALKYKAFYHTPNIVSYFRKLIKNRE